MAYRNEWIKAMIAKVEGMFETQLHPFLEDEYYGHEFMQYRLVKALKGDIFFKFCEYGNKSFISVDGHFFYEKNQSMFDAFLGEIVVL